MSDALSLTEIDGQQVELLPDRIVMSMFTIAISRTLTDGSTGGSTDGSTIDYDIALLRLSADIAIDGTELTGAG